nr:serine hydrolase [Xylophilus sp.]
MSTVLRSLAHLARALVLVPVLLAAGMPQADDGGAWRDRLAAALDRAEAEGHSGLGVYVLDLASGESVSHRGAERWYLASMVKVPVAIAVLRAIERGQFTLDTTLLLRADDYVDGGGTINQRAPDTPLSIAALMEQMIIHSDNTASDMLIGLVGLDAVNAVVAELAPEGSIGPVTRLSDVRHLVYGRLVPDALRLGGTDLVALNRVRDDGARLALLARLTGTPVAHMRLPSLQAAYDGFYASGLNSGRLDGYAQILVALHEGRAVGPRHTAYLLGLMRRVATGTQRIQPGLPADVRWEHKTGTQRGRFCDAGLVRAGRADAPRYVAVVACTRGDLSLARSELALRRVGAALCRSGLITNGVPDAPSCPSLPAAAAAAAAAPAARPVRR